MKKSGKNKKVVRMASPVDQTPPVASPIDMTNSVQSPVGMQPPQGMPPAMSPEALAMMYANKQNG